MISRGNLEKVRVDEVVVGKRWRKPTAAQIEMLRKSLRENRLIVPIGVRRGERQGMDGEVGRPIWILVHGATRLAAAKLEGWTEIDAQVVAGSEVDFEKAELAENLHRGELTKLQRDREIARYIELCGGERFLRGARAKIGQGRPEGGIRAAARTLKVPPSTVRDAMKAGTITEPAATVIADLGLANSPGAYRTIALEPMAEAQVAKAREIASQKEEAAPAPTGTSLEGGTAALIVAWKNASSAERRHFLRLIGHSDCSALMGLGRSTQARTKVNGSSTATVNGSTPRAPKQQLVLDWPEPHRVADRAGNKGSK